MGYQYQVVVAQAFQYRGWYCTISEALGGYRVHCVAMTMQFKLEYISKRGCFRYADEFKHCGKYSTFKVHWAYGYERAIKKAKKIIDETLGEAPIY